MYVKTFSLVCNGRTVILNDEGQQEDREGDSQEEDPKVEGQEEDHAVEGQEEDHEEMEDFAKRKIAPAGTTQPPRLDDEEEQKADEEDAVEDDAEDAKPANKIQETPRKEEPSASQRRGRSKQLTHSGYGAQDAGPVSPTLFGLPSLK